MINTILLKTILFNVTALLITYFFKENLKSNRYPKISQNVRTIGVQFYLKQIKDHNDQDKISLFDYGFFKLFIN